MKDEFFLVIRVFFLVKDEFFLVIRVFFLVKDEFFLVIEDKSPDFLPFCTGIPGTGIIHEG